MCIPFQLMPPITSSARTILHTSKGLPYIHTYMLIFTNTYIRVCIIYKYIQYSYNISNICNRGGTKVPNTKSRRGANKEFSHNQDHMIHNWIAKYVHIYVCNGCSSAFGLVYIMVFAGSHYKRSVDEPAMASHFFLPFYTHDCYESKDIGTIPWTRGTPHIHTYIHT